MADKVKRLAKRIVDEHAEVLAKDLALACCYVIAAVISTKARDVDDAKEGLAALSNLLGQTVMDLVEGRKVH